jgi:transposase
VWGVRRSRQEWERLVRGWERSGLSQQAYCERRGISVASLQRWRRLLAPGPGTESPVAAPAPEFVPVTLVDDAAAAAAVELTLVLRDGLRLEIGAQCRAETLKRVLGVLRESA